VRIFSGIQPTGRKHLGNYIGAIAQYVSSQERGEGIFCIVDLHAITVSYESGELRERLYDTLAILLAAGLDPGRSILFRQSDVHEHTELTWLLSSVTELGRLQRMHQRVREEAAGDRIGVAADLGRTALGHQVAAALAGAGADVDDVVGAADRVFVVLDDDQRISLPGQLGECAEQYLVIPRVQADRGLVQHIADAL